MSIKIEAKDQTVDRETDELLIVAEGFVSNLWAMIAEEVGLLPTIKHELSASTMAQLGEISSKLIPDYSD